MTSRIRFGKFVRGNRSHGAPVPTRPSPKAVTLPCILYSVTLTLEQLPYTLYPVTFTLQPLPCILLLFNPNPNRPQKLHARPPAAIKRGCFVRTNVFKISSTAMPTIDGKLPLCRVPNAHDTMVH